MTPKEHMLWRLMASLSVVISYTAQACAVHLEGPHRSLLVRARTLNPYLGVRKCLMYRAEDFKINDRISILMDGLTVTSRVISDCSLMGAPMWSASLFLLVSICSGHPWPRYEKLGFTESLRHGNYNASVCCADENRATSTHPLSRDRMVPPATVCAPCQ